MAKQKIKFNELVENKTIGNSLNWTYSYDGRIAKFFHNGNLMLERAVDKNVVYVFNAQRGAEFLDKIAAPKDPRMKLFWEYGWYKGHFQKPNVSSRYQLIATYDVQSEEDEYLLDWNRNDSTSDESWIDFTRSNVDFLFRDMYTEEGDLLISAVMGRDHNNSIRRFWFDPEKATLQDVEWFFKKYPYEKWVDRI